ncbi:MAG: S8 family serine peptidase [Mariprofundaceae bacterium]
MNTQVNFSFSNLYGSGHSVWLLVIGVFLLFFSFATESMAATGVGLLRDAQGSVSIERAGKLLDAKVGMQLHEQDIVITRAKSFARIEMKGGDKISLGYRSQIAIETYRFKPGKGIIAADFKALIGKFMFAVNKLRNSGAYHINTQTAVLGVRGTKWLALVEAEKTEIAGLEGRVSMSASGTTKEVGTGESVAATPAGVGAVFSTPQSFIDKFLQEGLSEPFFEGAEVLSIEENFCRDKAPDIPKDYHFKKRGGWGQKYEDQWGIKRVGFTADRKSAWHIEDGSARPVVVAVIDTGLDWNHKDFSWKNIWHNPDEIPDNGKDDDHNGFVDDVIGWDFVANSNKPWDDDGHGTFVAGIIAASHNNIGIAGINKGAKIMVLKALNAFGHTRASNVAQAIFYAADQGAQIINISVGGKHVTQTEQDAINYAHSKGALIIMAAGNEAMDTADYSSGMEHLITVAATDTNNKRLGFSNWGQHVDIAAPGIDILSLRARRTDLMAGVPGIKYTIGAAYVGEDKRYFRAGGTSFAAPIVAGTASLIWAKYPKLTHSEVKNMLLYSAKDIETSGWDQLTGYGLLDARAALLADPNYYTISKVAKVAPAQQGGKMVIEVFGSSGSSDYRDAWLELGFGEKPKKWKRVSESIPNGVENTLLAAIDAKHISKRGAWTVRLVVKTKKHGRREARGTLNIN